MLPLTQSNSSSQDIYYLLKDLFLILDNGDRLLLKKYGLSVGRFNLLSHLARLGQASPKELGVLMLCDKANITGLMAGLEKDGLIERRPDPSDGRKQVVCITGAGRTLWENSNQDLIAMNVLRFELITADGQAGLCDTLTRIRDHIRDLLPEN